LNRYFYRWREQYEGLPQEGIGKVARSEDILVIVHFDDGYIIATVGEILSEYTHRGIYTGVYPVKR
jgi:hypothetical protein